MSSLVKSFINRWKFTHAYKKDIESLSATGIVRAEFILRYTYSKFWWMKGLE